MRVKMELEAQLALARGDAMKAENKAREAEVKLKSFRRDARELLEAAARSLTTANQRRDAADTLRALSRRLELEAELESLRR
jgi:hypothetical protein